jgi:hypothetical protein
MVLLLSDNHRIQAWKGGFTNCPDGWSILRRWNHPHEIRHGVFSGRNFQRFSCFPEVVVLDVAIADIGWAEGAIGDGQNFFDSHFWDAIRCYSRLA